jgi:hypothetical protein
MKRRRSGKFIERDSSVDAVVVDDYSTQDPSHGTCDLPKAVVGRLVEVNSVRRAMVDFPDNPAGATLVEARSLVPLRAKDRGAEVLLAFEGGEATKPIIVGTLPNENADVLQDNHQPAMFDAVVDGETLTLTARSEIVIRCGKASITLTKAGKLLIQGEYVVSRSAGVNKIRGGSVQIN